MSTTLFAAHTIATDSRRFVAHFEWAYRRWLRDPDCWLGLAMPVLDDDGWLTFEGRWDPIDYFHRLARWDRVHGIGRTTSGLIAAAERFWRREGSERCEREPDYGGERRQANSDRARQWRPA